MRRTLKIGDKLPVFLAPMAGYTDYAFRKICFECGVSYAVSEMVSSVALSYGDEKTRSISKSSGDSGIQLFGHNLEFYKKALEELNQRNDFLWYDLNFGCPAPKIVKNHDGSYLLRDLKLLGEIVRTVKKFSNKPVSAKMRLGFNEKDNYLDIARAIEEAGADFITVHGRTREMFYSGEADWEAIYKIRDAVTIPVIGNGDIKDAKTAKRILNEELVDGIAIGRGAIGNPFIFSEIASLPVPDKKEIIIRHFKYMCETKEERVAVNQFKKHLIKYLNNSPEAKKLRTELQTIQSIEAMKQKIDILF